MRGTRTDARRRRHNRVRKNIHGSATRPRLAVFRSNRYIYAQVIDDDSGRTLAAASSQEKKLRKKTLTAETASEVGKLVAATIRSRTGTDAVVRFGDKTRIPQDEAGAEGRWSDPG